MSARGWLYRVGRWLGDWGSVKRGTPGPRLFRRGIGRILASLFFTLVLALPLPGQVTAEAVLQGGVGRIVVHPVGPDPVSVRVEVWESRERPRPVKLTRRVRGAMIWPREFTLRGDRQVVRILLPDSLRYERGRLLRVRTTFTPLSPPPSSDQGVQTHLRKIIRIVTKLYTGAP